MIALALLLAATPQVKFELASPEAPLIIVPVKVNGKGPFRFILDTGASGSELTPAAAKKIGLKLNESAKAKAVGAGGSIEMDLGTVDSLEIGGAVVKDMTFAVGEMKDVAEYAPNVDGLVGYDFLKNFVVTIDYPQLVVRFAAPPKR